MITHVEGPPPVATPELGIWPGSRSMKLLLLACALAVATGKPINRLRHESTAALVAGGDAKPTLAHAHALEAKLRELERTVDVPAAKLDTSVDVPGTSIQGAAKIGARAKPVFGGRKKLPMLSEGSPALPTKLERTTSYKERQDAGWRHAKPKPVQPTAVGFLSSGAEPKTLERTTSTYTDEQRNIIDNAFESFKQSMVQEWTEAEEADNMPAQMDVATLFPMVGVDRTGENPSYLDYDFDGYDGSVWNHGTSSFLNCQLSPYELGSFSTPTGPSKLEISPTALTDLQEIEAPEEGNATPGWLGLAQGILGTVLGVTGFGLVGAVGAMVGTGLLTAGAIVTSSIDYAAELRNEDDPGDAINDNFVEIQSQLGELQTTLLNLVEKRTDEMTNFVLSSVSAAHRGDHDGQQEELVHGARGEMEEPDGLCDHRPQVRRHQRIRGEVEHDAARHFQ